MEHVSNWRDSLLPTVERTLMIGVSIQHACWWRWLLFGTGQHRGLSSLPVFTNDLFIAAIMSACNGVASVSMAVPASTTSSLPATAPICFHTAPSSINPRQYSAAIETKGNSVLTVVFTLTVVRNKSASSLPRGSPYLCETSSRLLPSA